MDRGSEREKASRRTRDERDRHRDSIGHHDTDREVRDRSQKHRSRDDRDRDQKHRSRAKDARSREIDDESSHHRDRHHRSSRDDKHRDRESNRGKSHESYYDRESKRERSSDLGDERGGSRDGVHGDDGEPEREGSRDRVSLEGLAERRHSSRSHKRKEPEESEDRVDGVEKRTRVSDDVKEERRERRRKFEDGAGTDNGGKDVKSISNREEQRERRRFGDRVVIDGSSNVISDVKKEEPDEMFDGAQGCTSSNGVGGSIVNGRMALEPPNSPSIKFSENSLASSHHLPTKVSSISTTNENKGVSITRSHEVPGKSSTDGTSSAAGKIGSLSQDAIAKAKKTLQMQKELSEKIKKIPQLNKGINSSSDGKMHLGSKLLPSSAGILPLPVSSASASTSLSAGTATSLSTFPAAAVSIKLSESGIASFPGLANMHNIEAVKRAQELAAKMGFKQDPEFGSLMNINMFPGQITENTAAVQQKPAKAPVLRLDALGREIDEHGNVVNVPKLNNLSTLKVNINKQKKDAFQILKPELDVDPESNPHFDAYMGINKTKLLRPKRMSFQFVEEGKWSKDAEIIKLKSQFGEAQAKELKAKQAQLSKAKAEPGINPNLIEVSERVVIKEKPRDPIPEIEWWDGTFLLSGEYDASADGFIAEDKLKMEKITIYVEHPRPIEPPAEPTLPPPQPLMLTKKEKKKLRTQRRLAREKDKQEMIRQGLIEPPKPKVKMSNLMKVLGSEATQDPTRLEMEIRSAAADREQAHVDRNIARKLTPAERRIKKEKKLFDDPNSVETIVSVYKINDLAHPQTRFKVDVNAQENRLTGCTVISEGITVVVVEGGSKSIKRYGKLMLKRINWAAAVVDDDEGGDDSEEKPPNKCVLVWQGSVAKPSFKWFHVHECRTDAAARKYFADAGVGHYWDLAVNYSDDQL